MANEDLKDKIRAKCEEIDCSDGTPQYIDYNWEKLFFAIGYEEGKKDAVKHGHWIIEDDLFYEWKVLRCSCCNEEYSFDDEVDIKDLNYKFCPNCGAKMMDEEDE